MPIAFADLRFFAALPFAAPPDRAAALQAAFFAMCRDKAFLEEAERPAFHLSPIDAAATLLARSAATPEGAIAPYTHPADPRRAERNTAEDRVS